MHHLPAPQKVFITKSVEPFSYILPNALDCVNQNIRPDSTPACYEVRWKEVHRLHNQNRLSVCDLILGFTKTVEIFGKDRRKTLSQNMSCHLRDDTYKFKNIFSKLQ